MLFQKTLSPELKTDLESFIQERYLPPFVGVVCEESREAPRRFAPKSHKAAKRMEKVSSEESAVPRYAAGTAAPMPTAAAADLEEQLKNLDESFQEMLLRKIDEKGMRDSVCYKRAGVDRKLFSKIRSNPSYKPKKTTAVAFCMALELSFDEACELLRKAGYALSRSSKFDVIVEYFLVRRRYDLNELNIALYEYDQPVISGWF